MFRKVLLLAAALAIGTSVGIATPANAGLSLDPRSSDAYASADASSFKAAQASATTLDSAPAKPTTAATASTAAAPTAPTFRRTAAPKRVVAVVTTPVRVGYNRGYGYVHGVAY